MVDDREEVRYSKRGREMIEEKADREGGLLLLSLCTVSSSVGPWCHSGLLQQSPALK